MDEPKGLGLLTLIFLVLLFLKVTGTGPVALWSWWWIVSPLLAGSVLFWGALLTFCAIVVGGISVFCMAIVDAFTKP